MLKLIDIESHKREECLNRPYSCPYCGENKPYCQIKQGHNPIKCPNSDCKKLVCSPLLNLHVTTECDFSLVDCKYKEIGCKERIMRKDVLQHENSHQQFFISSLSHLQRKNSELQESVSHLEMCLGTQEEKYKESVSHLEINLGKQKQKYQESFTHLEIHLDRQKQKYHALKEQMNNAKIKNNNLIYQQQYYFFVTFFLLVISLLIIWQQTAS